IVFDVLYFLNIYKSDVNHNVGDFYYQIRIGGSIILNLLFMRLQLREIKRIFQPPDGKIL
ncbi:MAG: hypothetical protein J5685_01065, partial [Clostridiales bacterium]|nr:hypothetical protein [Clostridiales bacterium]